MIEQHARFFKNVFLYWCLKHEHFNFWGTYNNYIQCVKHHKASIFLLVIQKSCSLTPVIFYCWFSDRRFWNKSAAIGTWLCVWRRKIRARWKMWWFLHYRGTSDGRCRGLHSYVSKMEWMLSFHSPCIYMYYVIQIQMEDVDKYSQMTAVLNDSSFRWCMLICTKERSTKYNCMQAH